VRPAAAGTGSTGVKPAIPASLASSGAGPGIGLCHAPFRLGTDPRQSDPLIHALARYLEALDRRYPDGPAQMRREGLDGRANITGMHPPKKGTAA
jgi:hypothetical protein